ncbi:hypothetical protein QQP08_008802 [Theobroma cacao]|nr:hypothetical protein QQP08_008802 [Theobroma cacao]
MEGDDVNMAAAESTETDLDDMKRRLKEMEEEAAALREMQAKVEKEMGSVQDTDKNFEFKANPFGVLKVHVLNFKMALFYPMISWNVDSNVYLYHAR